MPGTPCPMVARSRFEQKTWRWIRLKRPSVHPCVLGITFYSPYQTPAREWMRQHRHTSLNLFSRRRRWARVPGLDSQPSTASSNKAVGSFGLRAKKAEEPYSKSTCQVAEDR